MAFFDIDISDLNGNNGFRLDGVTGENYAGHPVSNAGDINGDGFDDVIVGDPLASPNGVFSGSSYVVFGKAFGFSAAQDLLKLNGINGFRLEGIAERDFSGQSVSSAGDFNGDGFDDFIIGASFADPNGVYSSGSSYIVFGKNSGFQAVLELSSLDGKNGFRLDGYDQFGSIVSSAGDVNGDGFDDLIIGTDGNSCYVIFGKSTGFGLTFDISNLNGSNGFRINGISPFDGAGESVSNAGDINNDGFDDLIIGASGADLNGFASGSSYVVFGKASGFDATFDLSSLNGSNGFRMDGKPSDNLGTSVSNAGDINGDGFDDFIIGAYVADPVASYVVFGKASGFGVTFDLTNLDGSNGFRLDSTERYDFAGRSVSSAGDINGDGFDDLIIGAHYALSNGSYSAGACYVIFGKASGFKATTDLSNLDISDGFSLKGVTGGGGLGWSVSDAGDVNNDGFDDMIVSDIQDASSNNNSSGTYVIFGNSDFGSVNEIVSTPGNNILRGTASANDTVTYAFASGPVTVSLNITTQQNTISSGLDTLISIENLVGSPFGDNLTGNSMHNILDGRAGNDILRGWSGADTLIGGFGNDMFFIENARDVVTEKSNEGIDSVSSNITYTLPAYVEKLTLTGSASINGTGNSFANVITGNSAANQLNGHVGNDILKGGAGGDTYFVENSGDIVTEYFNQGIDVVDSRITYTLPANVEKLILTGTAAINGTGNGLANVMTGNSAANQLNGGAGNDTLDGGLGANRLTGGIGNDMFKFTSTGPVDVIADYNVANDTIQLENSVFTALTTPGTLAAGQFRVGTRAVDANDHIIYNSTTGALIYDANGNGAGGAVQIAIIGTGLALTNADIVVI